MRVRFEDLELTPRLADLLNLLLDGKSFEQMAEDRQVSVKTIRQVLPILKARTAGA